MKKGRENARRAADLRRRLVLLVPRGLGAGLAGLLACQRAIVAIALSGSKAAAGALP
jgi:hypothetical protein